MDLGELGIPKVLVKRIIHLADIHIPGRNIKGNDTFIVRLAEYKIVIGRLIESIKSIDAICVIAGDIFNSKKENPSDTGVLFNMLVNGIAQYCPIYIIAGNHDMDETCLELSDSIEAQLYARGNVNYRLNNYPIVYLNKTGYYRVGTNIGFGVHHMRDILMGKVEKFLLDEDRINIALYHGSVTNTFAGYKYGMFGDIHQFIVNGKRQVEGSTYIIGNEPFTYAYSGSLIQQNFGETLFDHGYLIWDLTTGTITHKQIANDYGKMYIRLVNDIIEINNDGWKPASTLITNPLFPQIINATIRTRITAAVHDSIIAYFVGRKVTLNYKPNIECDNISLTNMFTPITMEQSDIALLESFIPGTRELIMNPIKLTDLSIFTGKTKADIEAKCALVDKDLLILSKENTVRVKSEFSLVSAEWNSILPYGPDNYIDFEIMKSKVVLIEGCNSSGKTSIMDIIYYGIYGNEAPSRSTGKIDDIVSKYAKLFKTKPYINLHFKLNGVPYNIHTAFIERAGGYSRSVRLATMDRVISENIKIVDLWVETNIGLAENFLTTCMITQNNDYDLLALSNSKQQEKLQSLFNTEYIKHVYEYVAHSCDCYSKYLSALDSLIALYVEQLGEFDPNMQIGEWEHEQEYKIKLSQSAELDSIGPIGTMTLSEVTSTSIWQEFVRNTSITCPKVLQHILASKMYSNIVGQPCDELSEQQYKQLEELSGELQEITRRCSEFKLVKPEFTRKYTCDYTSRDEWIEIAARIKTINGVGICNYTCKEFLAEYGRLKSKLISVAEYKALYQSNMLKLQDAKLKQAEYVEYIGKLKYLNLDGYHNVYMWVNKLKPYSGIKLDYIFIELYERCLYNPNDELNTLKASLHEHDELYKDVPINPECEACKKQPHLMARNRLVERINIIQVKCDTYATDIAALQKYDDYDNLYNLSKQMTNIKLPIADITISEYYELLSEIKYGCSSMLDTIAELEMPDYESELAMLEERERFDYDMTAQIDATNLEWDNIELLNKYEEQYPEYLFNKKKLDEYNRMCGRLNDYRQVINDYIGAHNKSASFSVDLKPRLLELEVAREAYNKMLYEYVGKSMLYKKIQTLKAEQHKQSEIYIKFEKLKPEIKKCEHDIFRVHILNKLSERITGLLRLVTGNDVEKVTLNILDGTRNNLRWLITDANGQEVNGINRVGGHKRNLISFIIRLVIQRVCAGTNINCRQLFIDESFNAADSENLSRIPQLLDSLVSDGIYNTIMLVTHSEILKAGIKTVLSIERTSQGYSHIGNKAPESIVNSSTCIAVLKTTKLQCTAPQTRGQYCGRHGNADGTKK